MRFRHILSETRAGLRQNLTMTLAVIMTMWVSLSLFGAGLLASQQVNLMKGKWYDKIEISIFLCAKDTRGDQCDPGQDVTQGRRTRSVERWRPIRRLRRAESTSRPSKMRTRSSRKLMRAVRSRTRWLWSRCRSPSVSSSRIPRSTRVW